MSSLDWYILALSMLPVTELRATIPVAIALEMLPLRAFCLAVVGNLIPIFPILLLLTPLEKLLGRISWLGLLLHKILTKTRSKGEQIKQYGLVGLALFVLVPLPGTGAWTGAMLAWLFGFPRLQAFMAISVGVLGAGIIVTLASVGVLEFANFMGWEFLLGVAALLISFYLWRKKQK